MEFVRGDLSPIPIKSWISPDEFLPIPSGTDVAAQTTAIASLPMAFHHVALMPDAHAGYGMPIGGVLALQGALCPAAVGYDIGCGMLAVATDIPYEHFKPMRVQISREVKKRIPVGEGGQRDELSPHHRTPAVIGANPVTNTPSVGDAIFVNQKVEAKMDKQMGTLGGGNHFIEFDSDPQGNVWFVIHSGSRGVGHAIADHYMKTAQRLNAKWWASIPKDLACLPIDTDEGRLYHDALNWALDWALINRSVMAQDIQDILTDFFGDVFFAPHINVHHNDAVIEHHFDRDVWVHRKGATRARENDLLVIPGNMGQGTVIGVGLGNPDSFESCSHGAGRAMGRNEAKRTLDYDTERAKLDDADIILSAGRDGALDEMPAAYKDFELVMQRQSDLVEVERWLTPLSVIKG